MKGTDVSVFNFILTSLCSESRSKLMLMMGRGENEEKGEGVMGW